MVIEQSVIADTWYMYFTFNIMADKMPAVFYVHVVRNYCKKANILSKDSKNMSKQKKPICSH